MVDYGQIITSQSSPTAIFQRWLIIHVYPIAPVSIVPLNDKVWFESELVSERGVYRRRARDPNNFPLRAELTVEYPCGATCRRLGGWREWEHLSMVAKVNIMYNIMQ